MTAKTVRKSASPRKPVKPHPDFPLTPVKKGKWVGWCKKIRGKQHYFSGSADEALREWLAVKDDLMAGRDPKADKPGETVEWLCNVFMDSRKARLEAGEIKKRSLDDYHETVKRLAAFFGKTRRIETLGPSDFAPLKAHYVELGWGPVTIKNEIGRVNVVLKYAYSIEAVDRPIRTGPDFRKASDKALRKHRKTQPKKWFEAEQILAVIEAADVHMRAMVYLGINGGMIPVDIGGLRLGMLDLDGSWYSEYRAKTGFDRDFWLWPETVSAVRESIANRSEPKDPADAGLLFITKYGGPWWREGERVSPITQQFTKVTKRLGFYQAGVSFSALRHVFETVAGNSRDQLAVDRVMGHAGGDDDRVRQAYRESIDPDRLRDVCGHVRSWLFAARSTGGEA